MFVAGFFVKSVFLFYLLTYRRPKYYVNFYLTVISSDISLNYQAQISSKKPWSDARPIVRGASTVLAASPFDFMWKSHKWRVRQ